MSKNMVLVIFGFCALSIAQSALIISCIELMHSIKAEINDINDSVKQISYVYKIDIDGEN